MFRSRANEKDEGGDSAKNKDVNVPLVHTQDGKEFDPKAVQAQERKRRKRRIMKIAVYFMFGFIAIGVFAIWLFHKDSVEYMRFGSDLIFTVKLRSLEVRNAEGDSVLYSEMGRQLLASPYEHCYYEQSDRYEEYCLYWRKMARLRISQHSNSSTSSCYVINWEGLKGGFHAEDCFYLQNYQWYGRLTDTTPIWPIADLHLHYTDYYPAYPQGQTTNRIPVWFGSQSVSIFVHAKYAFQISWNVSDKKQFCIKSKNRPEEDGKNTSLLEYTICQGNSLPDIFNITRKNILNHIAPKKELDNITHERGLENKTNQIGQDVGLNHSSSIHYHPQEPVYVLSPVDVASSFVHEIIKNGSECGFLELFEGWEQEVGDLTIDPGLNDQVTSIMVEANTHKCNATVPISPFFSYKSQHFQHGVEFGYFVQDSLKLATRMMVWRGLEGAALDVTNPNATSWFVAIVQRLISKHKVKAIKLLHLDPPIDSAFHDSDVMYLEYNQMFYHRMASGLGVPLVIEMASGFNPEPVYTPIKMVFYGEDGSSCMNMSIPDSLIMGMSGFPLLMADLDASARENITEDMAMRWLQMAIFYPVLRIPNDIPLLQSATVEQVLKGVLALRSKEFLPYMNEVWESQKFMPIIRPLWWSAANKNPVLGTNDQFMVGDRLLVAPVLCEGTVARSVYLPEGTWVRSGMDPIKGPKTVSVRTDSFNVIPYFWRQKE